MSGPQATTSLFVESPEDLSKRIVLEKIPGIKRFYRRSSFVLPMTER